MPKQSRGAFFILRLCGLTLMGTTKPPSRGRRAPAGVVDRQPTLRLLEKSTQLDLRSCH
jgi:hypothetical protein